MHRPFGLHLNSTQVVVMKILHRKIRAPQNLIPFFTKSLFKYTKVLANVFWGLTYPASLGLKMVNWSSIDKPMLQRDVGGLACSEKRTAKILLTEYQLILAPFHLTS